jgi:hypothetical protein
MSTTAWIVAGGGGIAVCRIVMSFVRNWMRPTEIKRVPLLRAACRLVTLHFYDRWEERFLRAHPGRRAEISQVRRKLLQELGLNPRTVSSDRPQLKSIDGSAS